MSKAAEIARDIAFLAAKLKREAPEPKSTRAPGENAFAYTNRRNRDEPEAVAQERAIARVRGAADSILRLAEAAEEAAAESAPARSRKPAPADPPAKTGGGARAKRIAKAGRR